MQENNIGEARRAAIILAEALEKTSINFGIIGFSAKANDMVVCEKVYKRMEEKLDKRKLGCINCSGMYSENRDGSSFLTIAKHHFTQGDRKTPIIIVISDGIPYHSGTSYCNKEEIGRASCRERG